MADIKYHYNIISENGVECVNEKYPVIIFNGQYLPLGAIFIDYCASSHFFENIEHDLSLWFWRFTVCVGTERSDSSVVVVEKTMQMKKLLTENVIKTKQIISEKYRQDEVEIIYKWWVDTLEIMMTEARKTDISTWRGFPLCESSKKTL